MCSLESAPKRAPSSKKEHIMTTGKYSGTVQRWSRFNYAFARPDQPIAELGDKQEIFVGTVQLRRSRIFQPLQAGDRLSFDLKKAGDGRFEACNIRLLDMAAAA